MNVERRIRIAGVALLVCSFPLCALACYIDVSATLPVVIVLSSIGNALLFCQDMLRRERESTAHLDEYRELCAKRKAECSKLEERQ